MFFKIIIICGLEQERKTTVEITQKKKSSKRRKQKVNTVFFSSLLNTSSTSLEFSATILLQVLDLIAIAASNNFSTPLYVQNTTVYKMKEHYFWQAEHSSYIAGLGSGLHERENAAAAAGPL